jgi:VCBS repeat-containing protein
MQSEKNNDAAKIETKDSVKVSANKTNKASAKPNVTTSDKSVSKQKKKLSTIFSASLAGASSVAYSEATVGVAKENDDSLQTLESDKLFDSESAATNDHSTEQSPTQSSDDKVTLSAGLTAEDSASSSANVADENELNEDIQSQLNTLNETHRGGVQSFETMSTESNAIDLLTANVDSTNRGLSGLEFDGLAASGKLHGTSPDPSLSGSANNSATNQGGNNSESVNYGNTAFGTNGSGVGLQSSFNNFVNFLYTDELSSKTPVEPTFKPSTIQDKMGEFTIDKEGNWTFKANPDNQSVQQLGSGEHLTKTIEVTDQNGVVHSIAVDIEGSNNGPAITDVGSQTMVQGQATLNAKITATDPDNHDLLTFSTSTDIRGFSLAPDGSYSFTPQHSDYSSLAKGEEKTLYIPVTVTDKSGSTATKTLEISIVGTNDIPKVSSGDVHNVSEGAQIEGQLNMTDPDNNAQLSASLAVPVAGLTLDTDGHYTFDASGSAYQALAKGETLNLHVPVSVTDEHGATATTQLNIEVTGTNDKPLVVGLNYGMGSVGTDASTVSNTVDVMGQLSVLDADTGESHFTAQVLDGKYGNLSIDENGSWKYTADRHQNALSQLTDKERVEETFTVKTADGTEHDIHVAVKGANHPAQIAGIASAIVKEDATEQSAGGQLSITDPNAGEAKFEAQNTDTEHGHFSIDESGQWQFTLNNQHPDVQALPENASITEKVVVGSVDGTPKVIQITILGTNDKPVVSNNPAVFVDEDREVSGTIQTNDRDVGDKVRVSVDMPVAGLTLHENGDYKFDANNNAYQHLAEGEKLELHIPVTLTDNHGAQTHTQLDIQLVGSDDKPIIVGIDHAFASQTDAGSNADSNHMTVIGSLAVVDLDSGESQFSPQELKGTYGSLSIDESGAWQYSAEKDQKGLTELTESQKVEEVFTVKTAGGDEHEVHITLKGHNEPAVFAGVSSVTLKEDATEQSAGGQLSITDPNAGEAKFEAQNTDTEHGHFSIDESGQWQFTLNNQHPDVQALPENASITEKVVVGSVDGTPKVIQITILGTNDKPVVSNNPTLLIDEGHVATGTVQSTDLDSGDLVKVSTDLPLAGLTLEENGHYTFDANHSEYQHLSEGQTLDLHVPITLTDNAGEETHSQLNIQIVGSNDRPVVVGLDHALGSQGDGEKGKISINGELAVLDTDQGESHFDAELMQGNYGVLSIDEHGSWKYTASQHQSALTELTAAQRVEETFTVKTADGTEHDIHITLKGTNQPAAIAGVSTTLVKEDGANSSAQGQLIITDPDSGEAKFEAQSTDTEHGHFSIDESGQWQFALNNQHPDVQALSESASITEKVVVGSVDGTPKVIQITIVGTNDKPIVASNPAVFTNEDKTVSGQIGSTDTDAGDLVRVSVDIPVDGLTLDENGHYSFNAGHESYQHLGEGELLDLHIPVTLTDTAGGETHTQLDIQIKGTNDKPIIAGVSNALGTVNGAENADIEVSGNLVVLDVDQGESHFNADVMQGSYGTLSIDEQGAWKYTASKYQDALSQLNGEERVEESFKVKSADGTEHDVHITLKGSNKPAAIAGVSTALLKEDGSEQSASGQLFITDPNAGEAKFEVQSTDTEHGHFSIDESGQWQFTLNSQHPDIQALGENASLTESVIVGSVDGTPKVLQINILGTNDKPIVTNNPTLLVDEDHIAKGTIQSTDVDTGDLVRVAVDMPVAGLSLEANGEYTFDASHPDYQYLGKGEKLELHIPVTLVDSAGGETRSQLTIQIMGTNDKPIIGGVDHSQVAQTDADNGRIAVSGQLVTTDLDQGESHFSADLMQGTYGTLSIDELGNWKYSADQYQNALTKLTSTEHVEETFSVKTADGSEHDIHITLKGANQAAAIAGVSTGLLKEDGSEQVASGQLIITDPNEGEAKFEAQSTDTEHGHFSIDESGKWQFTLNNQHPDIQALPENASLVEKIVVGSVDGTPKVLQVTILGTNDKPIITNNPLVVVSEDHLIKGSIESTDTDTGDVLRVAVDMPVAGLTLQANGDYSFDASHPEYQHLAEGEKLDLHVPITIVDSNGGQTHSQLNIQVLGTNDRPIIGGIDHALGTEVGAQGDRINVNGELAVVDLDQGEGHFSAELMQGNYGTLSIDEQGSWKYSADKFQDALTKLTGNERVEETFTIKSADGTEHDINITLKGSNQPAAIAGVSTALLKEDGAEQSASGQLLITDPNAGEAAFTAQNMDTEHGHFSIDESGQWQFSLNNSHPDIQALGENSTLTERVVVGSVDGTPKVLQISILGTNDKPTVTNNPVLLVNEDRVATGTIQTGDTDKGDLVRIAIDIPVPGLTLHEDGKYTFDATHTAYQHLSDGEHLELHIPITLTDNAGGQTQSQLNINVQGSNDKPLITGLDYAIASVEGDNGDTVNVSGQLSVLDVDAGESHFSAELMQGNYGALSIDEQGAWNYVADKYQDGLTQLKDEDRVEEIFTIKSADGTEHDIHITLKGADQPAVIAGVSNALIKEDGNETTAGGQLSIVDPDAGESAFVAESTDTEHGHFSIDEKGRWEFTLNNQNPDVQALPEHASLVEKVVVSSVDGTPKVVQIAILGTNDKPIVSSNPAVFVDEDKVVTGTIETTDTDSGDLIRVSVDIPVAGLTLHENGDYTFDANNEFYQHLEAGENLDLHIPVTLTDSAGGKTQTQLNIHITGTNDRPIIGGVDHAYAAQSISDNGELGKNLSVSGDLAVFDKDEGESQFSAGLMKGSYGVLSIDDQGHWSYSADASQKSIVSLNESARLSDSFVVRSFDGTEHTIDITLKGSNQPAAIGGVTSTVLKEDSSTDTAVGELHVIDPDAGESHFTAQSIDTEHGHFSIDEAGKWVFTLDNSNADVQALGANASITEKVVVGSTDGTPQLISIQIAGSNDKPIISGIFSGVTDEDSQVNVTGKLSVSDIDANASHVFAVVGEHEGSFGSLSVDSTSGEWVYQLDNSSAKTQSLRDGESAREQFVVSVTDEQGAQVTHRIDIQITGKNDAPVVTATQQQPVDLGSTNEDTSKTFTESDLLRLVGATDADAGSTLSITSIDVEHGSMNKQTNGTWLFTPDKNVSGDDLKVTISVSDGRTHTTAYGQLDVIAVADKATSSMAESIHTDFSNHDSAHPYSASVGWGFVSPEQWGWKTDNPDGLVESGRGAPYGDPSGGNVGIVELEGAAHTPSNMYREITSQTGAKYHLSFDISGRDGTSSASSAIQVIWEGHVIDTISPAAYTFGFVTHSYDLRATGSNSRIELKALSQDGSGAVIDNLDLGFKGLTGKEDTDLPIAMNLHLTDNDGSEVGIVEIEGLPVGFIITDGTNSQEVTKAGETVSAAGWDLDSLVIRPSANYNGEVNAVVKAGSEELSNKDSYEINYPIKLDFVAVADKPEFQETQISATESGSVIHGSLHADGIDSGVSLTYSLQHAVDGLTLNKDGSYTLDPNNSAYTSLAEGQSKQVSVPIVVTSSNGLTNTKSLVIDMTGSNNAPVIHAISPVDAKEDGAVVSGDISGSDVDTGDTLTYSTTSSVAGFSLDAQGHWDFDPSHTAYQGLAEGENNSIVVPITVTDNHGATSTSNLTIQLTGTNDIPSVSATASHAIELAQASEDVKQSFSESDLLNLVGATDTDTTDTLSIASISAEHGSFAKLSDGSWQFSPEANFSGNNTGVTITVSDGSSHTLASAELDIIAVADKPTLDFGSLNGSEDTDLNLGLHMHLADNDGSESQLLSVSGLPVGFTLTDGTNTQSITQPGQVVTADNWDIENLRVTPPLNFNGQVSVVVTAGAQEASNNDIAQTTYPITLDFASVADKPTLVSAQFEATEGSAAVTGQLSASSVDTGITFSYAADHDLAGLTVNSDGSYSFDPTNSAYEYLAEGQTTQLSVPVTVTTSNGATDTKSLVINMTGTNSVPSISSITPVSAKEDGATVSGDIPGTDPDSGDTLTYSIDTAIDGFSMNQQGHWEFDPTHASYQHLSEGQTSNVVVPITVTDSAGQTHTQDLTIEVTGTNDIPEVVGRIGSRVDVGAIDEDQTVVLSQAEIFKSAGLHDVDTGDTHTIVGMTSVAGTFTAESNGDWRFVPDENYSGAKIPVSVDISDGHTTVRSRGSIDINSVTDPATPTMIISAHQHVMEFPSGQPAAIVSGTTVSSANPITQLTIDMTVLGGDQVATSGSHGATLISYGTPSDSNNFYIWKPENLTFRVGGHEYPTGVALKTDGLDHRYSFAWDGTSGSLNVLIDGEVVKHLDNVGHGATISTGGKIALGNDQDSFGGGFSVGDAFTGKMFSASVATTAVDLDVLAKGPMGDALKGDPHLETNVVATNVGIIDTTGNHTYAPVAGAGRAVVNVDTEIASPDTGATLLIKLDGGAPKDTDDLITEQRLTGIPAGTILHDGHGHSITVTDESQQVDISSWTLTNIEATLPKTFHENTFISYLVTTEGPDGQTALSYTNEAVVLDKSVDVGVEPVFSMSTADGSVSAVSSDSTNDEAFNSVGVTDELLQTLQGAHADIHDSFDALSQDNDSASSDTDGMLPDELTHPAGQGDEQGSVPGLDGLDAATVADLLDSQDATDSNGNDDSVANTPDDAALDADQNTPDVFDDPSMTQRDDDHF